jgi:hypothetical protein
MRPFEQADPNVQMVLVDRGNHAHPGVRDRARTARPRGPRRSAVSDALAALAFSRLFPFVPLARTSIKRNQGRLA